MSSVIVIFGPTASGKTKLSIELAKRLEGEIISADSMQVYKHMDIGTAKPDAEERENIPHYLMDEMDPGEEFNVARFQQLALQYIETIVEKGKMPIVVGGTGLYINSLIYNIGFSETVSDWKLREELKREAQEKGNHYLHERLRAVDPEAAEKIHENNVKRVIRAIEVFECTQKPISLHQAESLENPPQYNFILLGLRMDRERLYDRINRRVDLMLEKGLVDEVGRLTAMGYNRNTIAMQGIGYKEILSYFRGELTWEETVHIIKRDSRHYAKRQMTWFKRIENVHWMDVERYENIHNMVEEAYVHIKNKVSGSHKN